MFGIAAFVGILTAALGCDKQLAGVAVRPTTNLAGKPNTLFLLFGDRGDARLLPLATLSGGHITPISLDPGGWRSFDKLYFTPGSMINVFVNGQSAAPATVRRGMWTEADPLYKLPSCRSPRPLAALTMSPDTAAPVSLELLATSAPLTLSGSRAAATPADLDSARAFAERAAQRAGLTRTSRDELQLVVQAIPTGATDKPTLAISYSEKGEGGAQHPRHVFGLADIGMDSYTSTFAHSASDSLPEFRRLIDHLDLTGDGLDEIILEGWRKDGESFLVVMQFTGGRWREVARGTNSWCADEKHQS